MFYKIKFNQVCITKKKKKRTSYAELLPWFQVNTNEPLLFQRAAAAAGLGRFAGVPYSS